MNLVDDSPAGGREAKSHVDRVGQRFPRADLVDERPPGYVPQRAAGEDLGQVGTK
jgi:hypothetical protein